MRYKSVAIFVTIFAVLFPSSIFAATPKAGATCLKVGATQIASGKKFTCIKSGKKLVWNKGVLLKKPATEITKPNQTSNQEATTINSSTQPENSNSQNAQPPLQSGTNCETLGKITTIGDLKLQCRFMTGPKLVWTALNSPENKFLEVKSPNGVQPCKIEAPGVGNGYVGFPVSLKRNDMPAQGINHVLIAPIDFSDYVGEQDLSKVLKYQSDGLTNWVNYFSDGKLKFDIKVIDHWIRAPQKAAFYSRTEGDMRGIDGNKKLAAIAQEYIDLVTKEIDLTGIATVYILYPENMGVNATDLVPRVTQFNTKEGVRILSVFARSQYDWGEQTPQWVMWIHETGHDWGLLGHTPGNGWRMNIMTNQSGDSAALSAWERFLLDWMPADSVYCTAKENLSTINLSLSALEKADKKMKMVAIVLDKKRVLVIESHAIGEWSDVFIKNRYPEGFYGVFAYVVDTSYTGETIYVGPQGEALRADNGNDKAFPRYAYFEPIAGIDLKGRHTYGLSNFEDGSSSDAYTALVGDSFLVDGIRIKVLSTGEFETIEISKN